MLWSQLLLTFLSVLLMCHPSLIKLTMAVIRYLCGVAEPYYLGDVLGSSVLGNKIAAIAVTFMWGVWGSHKKYTW
jgi:hypothetical protein